MSKLITTCLAAAFLSACAPTTNDGVQLQLSDQAVLAVDPHAERNSTDPLRADIGRQFLVENFEAAVNPALMKAISTNRPGGIIFWNANHIGASELREVIRAYETKARASGTRKGLLYSTDYEGGGLHLDQMPGLQRFREGMTDLAYPIWLGKSVAQYGTELCALQGAIMASELSSIGINYPLTMVSDLPNSLLATRSTSNNGKDVATCLSAAMDSFFANGHVVFVTKHFPGLGQTHADTHLGTAVSDAKTLSDEQRHLQPFQDEIAHARSLNHAPLFSILTSHAKVPLFDPVHLTTESSKILRGVLRQQLNFNGLAVSDAMWMGDYGTFDLQQMLPVYLTSFTSGLDLLMIKGAHFGGAVEFFRQVYDNEVDPALVTACEQRSGRTWTDLRQAFIARLTESAKRLDVVLSTVGDPRSSMGQGIPRDATESLRERYDRILLTLDPRWKSAIPVERVQAAARISTPLASN